MREIIYIFCPEKDKKIISDLVKGYKNIRCFINFSSLKLKPSKKVRILYHNAPFLDEEHAKFLLKKVERGHKVYPLVDYLDKKKDIPICRW